MSQIVANAEMAKQLEAATGPVFIVNETGAMYRAIQAVQVADLG